ncbi:virulence factor [Sphingobacterium sp. lm-10]|uniref:virulence factor n=1 Tax=Sphingobacterium sp. lm-10 TaxID=2944904 RepID=UPI00201FF056|nr:virulence factor [Sphingobacterium sp. lm-10]MCL7986645.1 virulence factor [Sphingobacterium sp. lm-10]
MRNNIRVLMAIFFYCLVGQKQSYGETPDYVIPQISSDANKNTLIVFITGDGGYTSFSKGLLKYFNQDGYNQIVFDARKYFWTKKTPQVASRDFERYIQLYLAKSKCDNIYLIGHSFSAGILPFIINNFSKSLQKKIRHATFLSPDRYASLEVTFATMLNVKQKPNEFEVIPEALKMKSISSAYIFSRDDEEERASLFQNAGLKVTLLAGPHTYKRDFQALYNAIKLNNL